MSSRIQAKEPQTIQKNWGPNGLSYQAVDICLNYVLAGEHPPVSLLKQAVSGSGFGLRTRVAALASLMQQYLPLPSLYLSETEPMLLPLNSLAPYFLETVQAEIEQHVYFLCRELKCSRAQVIHKTEHYLQSLKSMTPLQSSHWIQQVTGTLIEELFGQSLPEITLCEDPMAGVFPRKWFRVGEKLLLLQSSPPLPGPVWAIHHGIHDLAHLFHLSFHSQWQAGLTPEQLLISEGFAVFLEFMLLERLSHGEWRSLDGTGQNSLDLQIVLRLGLLERCLRVDFDRRVHLNSFTPMQWVNAYERSLGIQLEGTHSVRFAERLHGLPGLAAGYMAALLAFHLAQDKRALLTCHAELDFSALILEER